MDRDGLDAIVALHNSSNWDYGNANGRYLSSIGGNTAQVSVVFPRDGAVTAVTGPVPTPAYWREFQRWVDDIRPSFFHPVSVVVDRLRELGLERSRIGIAGLAGLARQPNGLVSVGDYRALEEGLPGVDLVNATDLLYEARFVKSAEEIALLERSVSLVEAGLDVLEQEAGPESPSGSSTHGWWPRCSNRAANPRRCCSGRRATRCRRRSVPWRPLVRWVPTMSSR